VAQRVRMAKPRGYRAKQAIRFVSGRPLNGEYKTNHKWSKPGTQTTGAQVRATRWSYLPMRRRAGIQLLTLGAIVAIPVGFVISVSGTSQTLRVIVWLLLLTGVWVTVEKSRKYMHRKEVLAPLAEAIAGRIGDSRYMHEPKQWMSVPLEVDDGPTVIYLPNTYSPSQPQEKALVHMVARKVGLMNPTATFEYKGDRPYLELRPAPAPRELVSFSDPDIRAMIDRLQEGNYLIGLGPRDVQSTLDFNTQASHAGLSCAPGGGKSITGRALLMQELHDGGIALILDPRMDSQLWARGLPNVRYADTAQEIHEALLWLSGELDRRNAIAKQHTDIKGDVNPAVIGPRLLVVCEELNTLEMDLATYWRTIRQPGDPIKPVSLSALGRASNMGRARRINGLFIAQELLVQALGGPAVKANLSTMMLGRANAPTWNKLAPQCKVNGRYPRKSMHRGRLYVVTGDEPELVQVVYATEQEAIDYALSGIVTTFPDAAVAARGSGEPHLPQHADHSETGTRTHPTPPSPVPDEPAGETEELITLADAADRLQLPLMTLKKARERHPHFPQPVDPKPGKPNLYYFVELDKWALTRAYDIGGEPL
jgi:hypothetical protein